MSAFVSNPHDTIAGRETTAESRPIRHGLMARMVAAYATWIAWRIRRLDLARLESMDERTLADIGLTRSRIGFAVRFGRS